MKIDRVNDGVKLTAEGGEEFIQEISVYSENGSVQLWIRLQGGLTPILGGHFFQYLNAKEAMTLAKALERLAIKVLADEASIVPE